MLISLLTLMLCVKFKPIKILLCVLYSKIGAYCGCPSTQVPLQPRSCHPIPKRQKHGPNCGCCETYALYKKKGKRKVPYPFHTSGLIRFSGFSPFNPALKFVAANSAIFNSVSNVEEPICGKVTTFFIFNSSLDGSTGSCM